MNINDWNEMVKKSREGIKVNIKKEQSPVPQKPGADSNKEDKDAK